jgi:hypothetical protein
MTSKNILALKIGALHSGSQTQMATFSKTAPILFKFQLCTETISPNKITYVVLSAESSTPSSGPNVKCKYSRKRLGQFLLSLNHLQRLSTHFVGTNVLKSTEFEQLAFGSSITKYYFSQECKMFGQILITFRQFVVLTVPNKNALAICLNKNKIRSLGAETQNTSYIN